MSFTRRNILTVALALPFVATARQASAATHQVTIKGFKFQPAVLNVKAGDTIVFTNADGAPHTATAESGAFDTGRLNRGSQVAVKVGAGEHSYFCKFHRNMKGKIIAS